MVKKQKRSKVTKNHPLLLDWWQKFEYKHTLLAITSITVFVTALDTTLVRSILAYTTHLGLLGMFLAGVMFVSFFTAAPAVILLLQFADIHPFYVVAVVAGAGAAIGDLLIFKFFEERIGYELAPLAKKLRLTHFISGLHRKKARLRTLLVGSFIIASPLPDEAGIALLGLSRISSISLLLVTFALNGIGIALVVLIA